MSERKNKVETVTIPAQPGWDSVAPIWDGNVVSGLHYTPVIAWAVQTVWPEDIDGAYGEPDNYVTAVTPEVDAVSQILRTPTGRIIFLNDCEARDEAEAIAIFQNKLEASA